MNAEELQLLLSPDLQAWIAAHRDTSPYQLALQRHAPGFPAALAIGQVALLQKAESKLPSWARTQCLLTARAFEQATSEALAEAKPWGQGDRALDLSCGLGSDDRAIALRYGSVVALEPDPVLAAIGRHNHTQLGIANVELLEQTAEQFLAHYAGPTFDLIYIDPDRRDARGQRQFGLRDCQPDVLALLPRLLELGHRVLIKASPMLDLQAVALEVGRPATLWVAAESNECKELLIEIDARQSAPPARAAVFVRKGQAHTFVGAPDAAVPAWPAAATPAYLYEADTGLYKAGLAAAWYAEHLAGLAGGMLGREGYFFAAADQVEFHGHRFRVLAQLDFKPADIKKYCQAHGISKIQYTRRDFDVPLEQVRQQVKVPEGGQLFLVLTRMGDRGRQAFVAERL